MPEIQNENLNEGLDEELEEEERLALELEAEQELYAAQEEAAELHNQGQEFRHPSYFKYFVTLTPLAAIIDLVDLVDLTGMGALIGRMFSLAAWVVMLLVFWFTDTKQKRADEYVDNIQKNMEVIATRIANAEKNIVSMARLSRKVPGVKQLYRKAHLATIRKARVALRGIAKNTKNPIVRSAVTGALNLVPFLAIIPWMLVGVWLSYRAEKESYRNAAEASDQILESAGESATA